MKWLLAGTGCLCTLLAVAAYTIGPRLAFVLVVTLGVTAIVRAGTVIGDHVHHRAELDHPFRTGTVRDTTSRPV